MTVCCIPSSMRVGTLRAVNSFDGHVWRRHPALGMCHDLGSIGHRAVPSLQELYNPSPRAVLALMQPEQVGSMATYCPNHLSSAKSNFPSLDFLPPYLTVLKPDGNIIYLHQFNWSHVSMKCILCLMRGVGMVISWTCCFAAPPSRR